MARAAPTPAQRNSKRERGELLIKDWYINRHQRKERLKGIVGIKDAKEAIKDAAK